MNAALEKMLTELENTHFFGIVEIGYQNGVPGHASVKRNYKFAASDATNANRENRGDINHGQQPEKR